MKDSKVLVEKIIRRICSGEDMKYNPVYFCGSAFDTNTVVEQLVDAYQAKTPSGSLKVTKGTDFVNGLIHSVHCGNEDEYLKEYLDCTAMVFQNIEVIAGKQYTEQKFYYIFDKLYESNRRIMITGEMKPMAIPRLADRVQTQLSGGLLIEI